MTISKDDFTISTKGYLLYHGQLVHRLIAGPLAGKTLQPGDVVHHKNGNKLDCRPQNLEALPRNEHHSYLAPFGVEQAIVLPSQGWLDRLEVLLPARPRSPNNRAIGFYFTPQHDPNAIRRRLAEIAADVVSRHIFDDNWTEAHIRESLQDYSAVFGIYFDEPGPSAQSLTSDASCT